MKKVLSLSLLILTVILVLSFTSCGGKCCGHRSFSSYDECDALIEEFRANGGSNLPRFIFDFDNDMISNLKYDANYLRSYTDIPFKTYKTDYHSVLNFDVEFCLDEVDENGNVAESAYKFTISSWFYYPEKINDKGIIKIENDYLNIAISDPTESEEGYNYSSSYYIQVEETIVYRIKILSLKELTTENVDEIHKLLMDSIVLCK